MPFSQDRDSLKEAFGKFGEIVNISVPMSGKKKKGYAFIKYATHEEAKKAVNAMNGAKLEDREIKVNFSSGNTKADEKKKPE
jgi:RNA recognition motif-containing protein